MTVDMAKHLAKFFGNAPEIWMNLHRPWNLARAWETIGLSDTAPLEAA